MADVFSKADRSIIMRKVKSNGNKSTEEKLIMYFRHYQISGWRRHYPVYGHPDFVFLDRHVAVFVDGCFWHGHNCRNTRPKDNQEYWAKKRMHNIEHDNDVTKRFINRSWTVIRIWECELNKKNEETLKAKLEPLLREK